MVAVRRRWRQRSGIVVIVDAHFGFSVDQCKVVQGSAGGDNELDVLGAPLDAVMDQTVPRLDLAEGSLHNSASLRMRTVERLFVVAGLPAAFVIRWNYVAAAKVPRVGDQKVVPVHNAPSLNVLV